MPQPAYLHTAGGDTRDKKELFTVRIMGNDTQPTNMGTLTLASEQNKHVPTIHRLCGILVSVDTTTTTAGPYGRYRLDNVGDAGHEKRCGRR